MVELDALIEDKKKELSEIYVKFGANDYSLHKSQELDKLIVIAQRRRLEKFKIEQMSGRI